MIFKNTIAVAVLFGGLAACEMPMEDSDNAANANQSNSSQLVTQNDLNAVVGKTLTFREGSSFVISADGTLSGFFDGTPLVGTYEMRDGFF